MQLSQERTGEVLCGYRLPGFGHDSVATYIPEFRHIWTSPRYSHAELQQVLSEEFIHATQTAFRPAELLPLYNYLSTSEEHPHHEEFRDLIEALYCSSYVLATGRQINPAKPLALESPYRDLGERIIRLAQHLTRYHEAGVSAQLALRQALWGLVVCLLNVVPRVRHAGHLILDCLSNFQPSTRWSDSRTLLVMLLCHLAHHLKSNPGSNAPFALVRPNDLHQTVFRAVDLVHEFLRSPSERVIPTTPLLTAALTLDLHRTTHVLWARPMRGGIATSFEIWSWTEQNVRTMRRILEPLRRELLALAEPKRGCAALILHLNFLAFIQPLLRRLPNPSLPYWVHESVELLAALLQQVVLSQTEAGFRCPTCQEAFQEPRFKERAASIANASGADRTRLIQLASEYPGWLRSGCLQLFRESMQIGPRRRVNRPGLVFRRPSHGRITSLPSYALARRGQEILAQFLPALGQIWILPACPDSMLTQVLSHEMTHHNQCALNPSQNVHLRALLLNRPLADPRSMTELVEAGYVLGLTLSAGLGPSPARFPPAPRRTRELAARIARLAVQLARTAHPQEHAMRAEVEATHALLMLLWHVIPARAGLGPSVITLLEKLPAPRQWRSRSDLWPMLHMGLLRALQQDNAGTPVTLMSPMEPHRAVAEMLIFLSHALSPVPERIKAVGMCLPALLELLTFSSFAVIPVIRLIEKPSFIEARISMAGPDKMGEDVIRNVVRTQTEALQRCRQAGVRCLCIEYLVEVLQRTALYRVRRRPGRLQRCLREVLDQLHVERFGNGSFSCPLCAQHLRDRTVQGAVESIGLSLSGGRQRLLRVARYYERWLRTDCLNLLRQELRLSKPVLPMKEFVRI